MNGGMISNFRIISKIGDGGMGCVYLGEQISLNRKVAIKELLAELTTNPQFKERFINEAKILAKLNHPNIVTVFDLLIENGKYYIIMEYVEGKTVSAKITEERSAFELSRCVYVFKQILSAFSYAHNSGIIHRDIKPSNIILSPGDVPKILDFGIAKITNIEHNLTRTGTKMGSIYYMSPEQVLAEPVDIRTDIYSLGITLFEMLTGNLPFDITTESDYKIQSQIVSKPLPKVRFYNPHLPEAVEAVISRATAKKPAERYSDCFEFIRDLENLGNFQQQASYSPQAKTVIQTQAPVNAMPGGNKTVLSTPYNVGNQPPGVQKKKSYIVPVIIAVILFVLLAGGAGLVYYYFSDDSGKKTTSDKKANDELTTKEEELKKREEKIKKESEEFKNKSKVNTDSSESLKTASSKTPGIYPEGSTRYLTADDVAGKSKYDLKVMRNEIFARHGYIFTINPEMIEYFNKQSWYVPLYKNVDKMMTEIEKYNVTFIKKYE
jgi:serine/threonine protein kinase